jgi:glycosyltransferase involved in cell wall biosynthesis
MIKLLKPRIAIYDCPDAIVFKENGRKQRVYDHLQKEILQKSPICLFTSKALLDDGKKYSRNYFYIPNGVDIENFSKRKKETPEIIKNVRGIILGVVGTLDERIDLGLLTYVLEEIKEASLFFVGPVQTQIGNLADHPRVVLTGIRPYEEMPSFIERFHVALIPYVVNSVTKAIYPVKLHEYLVLGKPVVSTDLPEVRQFSDVVRIAVTKEEFARSVRLALRERDETAGQRRMRIAQGNSWEKRINQISGILEDYL